ncbi:hypothetical protein PsexTeo8_16730 [Pseudomonas extremaustralis]|uniref:alginate O-acetyltransferase AlgX-related protein n=1 Tax=Pseudomonas extremaustralis TaxID=359110 RepID=UPI002AA0CF64|nr:hypothetical protein [Pseudomonas extremaustralis]MDY7065245.1 hypothetical protein [Pseudomonas extremaustralis]
MKRKLTAFLLLVFITMMIVPAINIIATPNIKAKQLRKKSFLYNMDIISRWTQEALYPLGISIHSNQVIIGSDDWLFLGDGYDLTLSEDRRPANKSDNAIANKISASNNAWNEYLIGKGVKIFKIMVGPNKGSIYSEHMPIWARPDTFNPTDALFAATGKERYIDLRPPLLAGKEKHPEPLYYKTDTHWNYLGGAIAFHAFAEQIAHAAPELEWPSEKSYALDRIDSRSGGDLSKFLRLSANTTDDLPIIHVSDLPIETTQSNFYTKEVISQGGNPLVDLTFTPTLVTSVGALNNKKVLWLRDSFGGALSQLMAATFNNVLQIHWSEALKQDGSFAQLVEDFKPDYVFITVVERSARSPDFTVFPPGFVSSDASIKTVRAASPSR